MSVILVESCKHCGDHTTCTCSSSYLEVICSACIWAIQFLKSELSFPWALKKAILIKWLVKMLFTYIYFQLKDRNFESLLPHVVINKGNYYLKLRLLAPGVMPLMPPPSTLNTILPFLNSAVMFWFVREREREEYVWFCNWYCGR